MLAQAVAVVRDYAIFTLDAKGNILNWNQGAELINGYKAKDVIGKNFSLLYTPADKEREHPRQELKEAKKIGRYEEEGWRVRKDGSLYWASVVITKLTDRSGELIGFSKVVRDLSARRLTEERLRLSEERFRLLVESVRDYAIFMLDATGCVVSWNLGAQKIKGYAESEILGKHFSVFYPETQTRSGKCEYVLEEAARTGRFEEEGWRLRKDGSMLWASVVITAVRDKKKRLIGYSKVTRDLTERKRAEDKLQRAYLDLERKVEDRTAALEEAIRVRDEFISVASHELKTPITSLKMQLQMLRHKTKPEQNLMPPAEKLASSLDTSLRQVNRLTALVEDLLDVARAQARKLNFCFERVDLAHLAQEVVQRHAIEIEAAGSSVVFECHEPVWARVDPFRLDQVLVNLLSNALKYAPGKPIHIRVEEKNGVARISVRDEGEGIPAAQRDKVFDRFVRAGNARNINGLGLGLFITKQIIEGHRGEIRVETGEGGGAQFVLEIPLTSTGHEANP